MSVISVMSSTQSELLSARVLAMNVINVGSICTNVPFVESRSPCENRVTSGAWTPWTCKASLTKDLHKYCFPKPRRLNPFHICQVKNSTQELSLYLKDNVLCFYYIHLSLLIDSHNICHAFYNIRQSDRLNLLKVVSHKSVHWNEYHYNNLDHRNFHTAWNYLQGQGNWHTKPLEM